MTLVSPDSVCFFIPPGLKRFKLDLFERVGAKIIKLGGRVVRHDVAALENRQDGLVPIVGCTPELRPLIDAWRARRQDFLYWDRGYFLRVFATWLPRGTDGGYYRWTRNAYQMRAIRDVPADRWKSTKIEMKPWATGGSHIVIAAPTRTYSRFHRTESWIADTIDALARVTDRQLVIRDKESKRPLQQDLAGAHALVTHGSIAAVESVICGCPVFVHPDSAASLVGLTDLGKIEKPAYPDRDRWVRSLAYEQWNEKELTDGTLWAMLN